MRPSINTNQEAVQRNTFGPLYIKTTEPNKLSFYTYVGTEFKKIYTTSNPLDTVFLGSPEVFWWPDYSALMVRKIGGFDWQTFRVNSNIVDIAANPNSYLESDRIESGGFNNDMKIGGEFSLEPIFLDNYMLSFST
jgi:hypothetical protein